MHRDALRNACLSKAPLRLGVSLAVSLAIGLLGCNGAEEKGDAPATNLAVVDGGAKRIPADDFDYDAHQQRPLDLNKDGIPDAYQYSRVVDDQPAIFRKEVDINFDGKIDLIRSFNKKGDLVAERLDHDFDGRIDVVNHFEKGVIIKKEYDTNFDSNVDLWRYFDKGTIARKEADLNHDGKVDYWEYYEEGKLDRIGVDRDSDGEVDEWETAARG